MAWKNYKFNNLNIECRTDSNYNGTTSTVVFVNESYCGEIPNSSTSNSNFTEKLQNFIKSLHLC